MRFDDVWYVGSKFLTLSLCCHGATIPGYRSTGTNGETLRLVEPLVIVDFCSNPETRILPVRAIKEVSKKLFSSGAEQMTRAQVGAVAVISDAAPRGGGICGAMRGILPSAFLGLGIYRGMGRSSSIETARAFFPGLPGFVPP
jgi:hypothetical protein